MTLAEEMVQRFEEAVIAERAAYEVWRDTRNAKRRFDATAKHEKAMDRTKRLREQLVTLLS